jgi:hypothetical protein
VKDGFWFVKTGAKLVIAICSIGFCNNLNMNSFDKD